MTTPLQPRFDPGAASLGALLLFQYYAFNVTLFLLPVSCFLSHSFRCALVLLLLCQRPSHMYLSKPLRLLLNAAPSRSSPAHRCSVLFVVAQHRCLMLLTTGNHIPVRVDRCGAGNHALPYKARVAPRDDCLSISAAFAKCVNFARFCRCSIASSDNTPCTAARFIADPLATPLYCTNVQNR